MVAVDAASGGCLGLVAGSVYIRKGRIKTPHAKRALEDKESRRWIDTAVQAKSVLAEAATVTIVADRESDVYAELGDAARRQCPSADARDARSRRGGRRHPVEGGGGAAVRGNAPP